MDSSIIVGILTLIGTVFGTLMGTLSMSKILSFRIELLEDKVDKLGSLLERVALVENNIQNIHKYVKDNCE